MAEWPNVPDSKSGVPQGTVGSNPTLSANEINNLASLHPSEAFLFFRSCSHHVAISTVICTAYRRDPRTRVVRGVGAGQGVVRHPRAVGAGNSARARGAGPQGQAGGRWHGRGRTACCADGRRDCGRSCLQRVDNQAPGLQAGLMSSCTDSAIEKSSDIGFPQTGSTTSIGLLERPPGNPNFPRCSSQSSGTSPCRPRIACKFKCRGCRPSRIARMMSGANRVIRSTSHTHPTLSLRLRASSLPMKENQPFGVGFFCLLPCVCAGSCGLQREPFLPVTGAFYSPFAYSLSDPHGMSFFSGRAMNGGHNMANFATKGCLHDSQRIIARRA